MPIIWLVAGMAAIYIVLCRYHDWQYRRNYAHEGPDSLDRVRQWSSPRREFRERAFLLCYGGTIGFLVGLAIHTRIAFGV